MRGCRVDIFCLRLTKTIRAVQLAVPHQNKLLRTRATELGFGFGLGVGEVVLDDVFLGLFETVRNASEGDIVEYLLSSNVAQR